jgi:type I restriction enzyme S subunit
LPRAQGTSRRSLGVIPEDWEVKRLGEVISIGHGKDQKGIESQNGKYPILASGGEIGRTNISLYSGPSALFGRKGTIDKPQYSEGPFWTIDTLFFSIPISACNMRYVFYLFQRIEWRSFNEASGVPSLSSATIQNILCLFPKIAEQSAIVITLDKMEKEIQSLESKRDKYTQIKQGMMEQLLTGKVRLVG